MYREVKISENIYGENDNSCKLTIFFDSNQNINNSDSNIIYEYCGDEYISEFRDYDICDNAHRIILHNINNVETIATQLPDIVKKELYFDNDIVVTILLYTGDNDPRRALYQYAKQYHPIQNKNTLFCEAYRNNPYVLINIKNFYNFAYIEYNENIKIANYEQ